FSRRLALDGLTFDQVLPRLSTVRRNPEVMLPWHSDAKWIEAALKSRVDDRMVELLHTAGEPLAFEDLLAPVIQSAQEMVWSGLPQSATRNLTQTSVASLYHFLARRLSDLCAHALHNS